MTLFRQSCVWDSAYERFFVKNKLKTTWKRGSNNREITGCYLYPVVQQKKEKPVQLVVGVNSKFTGVNSKFTGVNSKFTHHRN